MPRQGPEGRGPSGAGPAVQPTDAYCQPALSIVIPTFNGLAVLRDCLRSVMAHRPSDAEVIVVDDGSDDGTAAWVRRRYPKVRLVRLERNRGFCAAINAGVQAARAPVVQTLNNDTVVTAGWAAAALELFADPHVGSVAPLVWLMRQPGQIDSAGLVYHVAGYARNRGNRQRLAGRFQRIEEVFGASASAGFYRRAALLQIGGFPEQYGAYYDDVDVAFRLRWAGYRCLFTPYSQVLHRESGSYATRSAAVLSRFFRNEERAFWSNLPRRLLVAAGPRHLLELAVELPLRVYRGEGVAYLCGKLAAVGDLGDVIRQRRRRRALASGPQGPQLPLERSWCWRWRQSARRRAAARRQRPSAPSAQGTAAEVEDRVQCLHASRA